jgi:hypothetical protein
VLVGETLFALRLLEAQCIEVLPAQPAIPASRSEQSAHTAPRDAGVTSEAERAPAA